MSKTTTRNQSNSLEKEKKLLERIEKAKSDLLKLQNKRKMEIGKLAYKHGLESVDDVTLDKAFEKLAKELNNGNKR